MNKALFLDRDGTINVEKNYLYKTEDFEFIPEILNICKLAQNKKYLIIVITNQSGVSRGYYTKDEMDNCNHYMIDKFKELGITITDVFSCTSMNDNDYDRKPNPGMFLKAKYKYKIDMQSSISIGDKKRDIEAAQKAGIKYNYLIQDLITRKEFIFE